MPHLRLALEADPPLIKDHGGLTPWASMSSALSQDIKRKESPFKRWVGAWEGSTLRGAVR